MSDYNSTAEEIYAIQSMPTSSGGSSGSDVKYSDLPLKYVSDTNKGIIENIDEHGEAIGQHSLAIGKNTNATNQSFAFGENVQALGANSVAFGYGTRSQESIVEKKYLLRRRAWFKGISEDGRYKIHAQDVITDDKATKINLILSKEDGTVAATGCYFDTTKTWKNRDDDYEYDYYLTIGEKKIDLSDDNHVVLYYEETVTVDTSTGVSKGYYCFTAGQQNTALVNASAAFGLHTKADGNGAFSEGYYTYAHGQGAHAEGCNTTAENTGAHAEGNETKALQNYSHAEGYKTTAEGSTDHAEGSETTAKGGYGSHAEGWKTTASQNSSHAEGRETTANGTYSHSEGEYTYAYGEASHAEGIGTYAKPTAQHVQGKYNVIDDDSKYAFIIGNGSSDTARNNAMTVSWDGDIRIPSELQITSGGMPYENGNTTIKYGKININNPSSGGLFNVNLYDSTGGELIFRSNRYASTGSEFTVDCDQLLFRDKTYRNTNSEFIVTNNKLHYKSKDLQDMTIDSTGYNFKNYAGEQYSFKDGYGFYIYPVGSETEKASITTDGNGWFAGKVSAKGTPTGDDDLVPLSYLKSMFSFNEETGVLDINLPWLEE